MNRTRDDDAIIPQWNPHKTRYIPQSVGLLSNPRDPEFEPFRISFKFYNDDECEIADLYKNRGRQALLNIKTIGKCCDFQSLKENNIDIYPVENSGDYKRLYRGLEEDIEIKEHKIQGDSRIFYFVVNQIFYIIAIKDSHIETKKHRNK